MNLVSAQSLCIKLMIQHGLTKEKCWKFEWMNSKDTAGLCCMIVKQSRFRIKEYLPGGTIKLSKFITPIHSDDKVKDTILHEIAHALTPGHNHDYVWQKKAIEIGCDGQRCFAMCDDLNAARKEISKYSAKCDLCSNEFHMSRLPKRDKWCKCVKRTNGFLNPAYKLIWILKGTEKNIHVSKPAVTQLIPATSIATPISQIPVGIQPLKSNTAFPDTYLKQEPDTYKKMLDKFEKEFLALPFINGDISLFEVIAFQAIRKSNSWRTMNREVRKACNFWTVQNFHMTNEQFQGMFFYESIMLGRVIHGAKAPWINSNYKNYELPQAA